MAKGIKLAITGTENSGKTTLVSNSEKAIVISTDNKAFSGAVAHYRYNTYKGLDPFISTLYEKVEVYNEKFGEYPKSIIVDSVTHLQNAMAKWANNAFNGFEVWNNLGKDIQGLNDFFEESLINEGINVIYTAHVTYDSETGRFKIDSPGAFGKVGGWLSVTDEARYLEVKNNKRIIHYTTGKFPCRSLIPDIPENTPLEKYDLLKDIEVLETLVNTNHAKWEL